MSNLVLYSIPAFLFLLAVEILWAARHPEVTGYERRDTITSLSLGVVNVVVSSLTKLATVPLLFFVYHHRLVDLGAAWWSWPLLLVAEDFCYYWFHRSHHEVRVLWSAHVNHHSSRRYNLSTALRQCVLTPLTGPWFWLPLPLLGFAPWMVMTAQAWSLLYQFWIHTEAIDRLGPLEAILNTPSHHRVHHGKNVRYLDRNHGGIFIVWDRLFGTYAREDERVVYGLTHDLQSSAPAYVAFHEVAAIAGDVRRAPTLRARLGYIFAPPGWSHDGSSRTARELQDDAGL
jgi:sterol desaturase/sphingolipid hydroxylase (fatty acid hydroxylase superfamily)